MRGTTRDMSNSHEIDLVATFGGRRTPGSGNQPNNPMDGRLNRYTDDLAYAWDGKSSLGKSISVTRAMWEKAQEQALSERPMLALRWYDTERLRVGLDLIVVGIEDFAEMLELSRQARLMKAFLAETHDSETGEWTLAEAFADWQAGR